jgi:hypothetical protein
MIFWPFYMKREEGEWVRIGRGQKRQKLMSAKLLSEQKLKITLVLTFFSPCALQYFELAARRVSKVEACWHAQDINGRAGE